MWLLQPGRGALFAEIAPYPMEWGDFGKKAHYPGMRTAYRATYLLY
jgi:hypothetical protein